MIEKHYYVEDAPSPKVKNRYLIRLDYDAETRKAPIYRFDWKKRDWVEDPEMCQIFTGSIEVNPITEEEAYRIISQR